MTWWVCSPPPPKDTSNISPFLSSLYCSRLLSSTTYPRPRCSTIAHWCSQPPAAAHNPAQQTIRCMDNTLGNVIWPEANGNNWPDHPSEEPSKASVKDDILFSSLICTNKLLTIFAMSRMLLHKTNEKQTNKKSTTNTTIGFPLFPFSYPAWLDNNSPSTRSKD